MTNIWKRCDALRKTPFSLWDGIEVAALYPYARFFSKVPTLAKFLFDLKHAPAPIDVGAFLDAYIHLLRSSRFDEYEIKLLLHYEIERRYVQACPHVVGCMPSDEQILDDLADIADGCRDIFRKEIMRMKKAALETHNNRTFVPQVFDELLTDLRLH